MHQFKYTGREPVDVPALGLEGVARGDVIEVADPAIAEGLKGQPQWQPVKPGKPKGEQPATTNEES